MPFRCEEVLFSPTFECNLSCPHCNVIKTKDTLSVKSAKKFLKKAGALLVSGAAPVDYYNAVSRALG